MIAADKREALLTAIATPYAKGGMLGEPYCEDGCIQFIERMLPMLGIEDSSNLREYGRNWIDISTLSNSKPQFADIAVFQDLPFSKFHVALMLDGRRAIQSSAATNGVGRIDITLDIWKWALREIRRHWSLVGN